MIVIKVDRVCDDPVAIDEDENGDESKEELRSIDEEPLSIEIMSIDGVVELCNIISGLGVVETSDKTGLD